MNEISWLERAIPDQEGIRVAVIIDKELSPTQHQAIIQNLAAASVEVPQQTSELSFAIGTFVENSKPRRTKYLDTYLLDHTCLILTYPNLDTFKSHFMLASLNGSGEVRDAFRLSRADQLLITMLYDRFNMIESNLINIEEDLRTWSDGEPLNLKDEVMKSQELLEKQMVILLSMCRQLKASLSGCVL